ncbi:WD40-repeat-containing domain protein [Lentinula edodes]|uniref:WD40-repeat-containing domain protein n=1 Tax=Lentinula lateritia TaxID=40482 RepID=A0A9W9E403_9AGAR|nr:WD40-repeat-containing domain protein [Lentinula edodes]
MAPTVTSIQPRYIKDGSEAITALSFSMDGHYLASASKDTYLRVYDVHANFKKIQSEPCSSSISAIAWNTPDSFITGNSDGELFISSLKQRGEKAELIYESSSPINAVELDKTRRMMLICAGAYVNVMEQQEGINSTVAFSFNAGFTCYSFNTNSWAKLDISVDSRKRAVVELSAQSIQGHLVVIRTIRGFVHEEPCRVVQILPDTHSIAQVKALAYSEDGLIATGDGDPGQNAHTNFWTSVILIRLIEYCSTTIRTILGEFLCITIILLILVLTLKTLPIETQKSIARAIISAIQQNKPEPVHSAHSSRLLPPYVLQHFLSGFRDGWERSSLDDVVELSAALQREIISITGTVSLCIHLYRLIQRTRALV